MDKQEKDFKTSLGIIIGVIITILLYGLIFKIVWNDVLVVIVPTLPILNYWKSVCVFAVLVKILGGIKK